VTFVHALPKVPSQHGSAFERVFEYRRALVKLSPRTGVGGQYAYWHMAQVWNDSVWDADSLVIVTVQPVL
jgi:hypothetical protein